MFPAAERILIIKLYGVFIVEILVKHFFIRVRKTHSGGFLRK